MRKLVKTLLLLVPVIISAILSGPPISLAAGDDVEHQLFLPLVSQPAVPLPQSRILFTSDRTGDRQIWIMNTDGSGQTQFTDFDLYNSSGEWSPDGQQILFRNFFLVDVEPLGPSAVPTIYVMNADGSNMRPVTLGNPHDFNASWSGDSTRIVFERILNADEDLNIHVVTADGASQSAIAKGHQPLWSPVDEQIAYKGLISALGDRGLHVVGADGSSPICLSCIHDMHPQRDWPFTWSPDGNWIAYFGNEQDTILYAISADGTQVKQLSTAFPTAHTVVGIDWSPDGQSIVVDRGTFGSPNRLYKVAVTDSPSDPIELADEGSGGRWSPDGQWIAFFNDGIKIMDANDGSYRDLTTYSGDVLPEWKPNP
jgi:Tol biopolymer transport system component